MPVGSLFENFSPYARVTTAVAPFVAAVILRLIFGRSRVTQLLISLATLWFGANVLAAPYSQHMQQDLRNLHILH